MIGYTLAELRRLLDSLVRARSPDPDVTWSWSGWTCRMRHQCTAQDQAASRSGPEPRHVICLRHPDVLGLPGSGCHHVDMAVIFELVVNFGADEEAAGAAAERVRRAGHVGVRGVPVPLGEPYVTKLTRPSAYIEFSVHPHGIGYGGPGPKPDLDPRSLTSDEITRIGHRLYDLLRNFSGYRAAIVGWDPESLVDVDDLEADWRAGDPPGYNGLVLADDLCDRWKLGPEWSAFEPGYRWLPYSGSKNFRLSRADPDPRRSAALSRHANHPVRATAARKPLRQPHNQFRA